MGRTCLCPSCNSSLTGPPTRGPPRVQLPPAKCSLRAPGTTPLLLSFSPGPASCWCQALCYLPARFSVSAAPSPATGSWHQSCEHPKRILRSLFDPGSSGVKSQREELRPVVPKTSLPEVWVSCEQGDQPLRCRGEKRNSGCERGGWSRDSKGDGAPLRPGLGSGVWGVAALFAVICSSRRSWAGLRVLISLQSCSRDSQRPDPPSSLPSPLAGKEQCVTALVSLLPAPLLIKDLAT